jgi:hypothetical protein
LPKPVAEEIMRKMTLLLTWRHTHEWKEKVSFKMLISLLLLSAVDRHIYYTRHIYSSSGLEESEIIINMNLLGSIY